MGTNVQAAQMLFDHIKKEFVYKTDTLTNISVTIGDTRIYDSAVSWPNLGILKSDRIVFTSGEDIHTTYAKKDVIDNYLEVDDALTFTSANTTVKIYFLPVLYKEYAPEQTEFPYNILSFIGRRDDILFYAERLNNIEFQINLYDTNTDDTDIENISDEYIRIFDRLCIESNDYANIMTHFELDTGIKINKDFTNSEVVLEKAISFSMTIKQI